MARIAIDMDNVMADLTRQMIDLYEQKHGVRVAYESLNGHPDGGGFPIEGETHQFIHQPGFFRNLPVMEDSQEVIRALMEQHEVFIVSAATEFPLSLKEKIDWLAEHFPFISWKNIVLCGSKTIIEADYMIDDHDKNLRYFKGEPILFSAPHNINLTDYKRVNNWKEVAAYFQLTPAIAG
ncbi:5'(3')-deoxyribonucleotidase [Chitinophaga sp. Cy-1792]|uniref:5' nucleotidase, NT5C type n=1 Tax=Chitinophaga sp. Cy-1792 TaxID=2608339 RepID=UPI00142091B3|nr:5'(3')-deoxyribonucleotidase [Chitinophaga sp. Cy-1792]NIG52230.1 5'(3')-deoxyribonucleotidase [Chitinophaga sp. Cy-1792]